MQAAKVQPAPDPRRNWLAAGALVGIVFVVFAPALRCQFVNLDDSAYVVHNKFVTDGLTSAGTRWAFTSFEYANWHPLTWLSLQLDASLWWPSPAGFHFTSVLLHAGSTALLFLALRALTGCFWRSIVVALLFGVHPLRVESVVWVAERKDVLSSFFGLVSLWAYAGYVRRPSTGRYLAVAIPFALSLLAKPMLVTLPFLLLVLDWWPLGRAQAARDWWRLAAEKLPLLALAVASSAVTFQAQKAGGAVMGLEGFSFTARLENALVSYAVYIGKTIWPDRLAVFYPHPAFGYPGGGTLSPSEVGGALLLLVGVTGAALALRQRAPYLLTGWLWYVGTLVPVIGLIQVGNQGYADRYTYLPQVGLWIALCWGVADLARAWPRTTLAAAAAAAFVLAAMTVAQTQYWENSLTLWKHAFAVSGECPTVLVNLGEALEQRDASEDVEPYYQKAAQLDPNSAQIRLDLGNVLQRKNKWEEAREQFDKVCQLKPNLPFGHSNLGNVYLRLGKYQEAAEQFDIASRLPPKTPLVFCNLGIAEEALGDFAYAVDCYHKALELQPDYPNALAGLGINLARSGENEKGIACLRQAASTEPAAVQNALRRLAFSSKPELGKPELARQLADRLNSAKAP